MTHAVMVDDKANSATEGMETTVPVTIVETPPMRAVALRAYEDTPYGKQPVTEVWTDEFVPELDRVLDLPGDDYDVDAAEDELRASRRVASTTFASSPTRFLATFHRCPRRNPT